MKKAVILIILVMILLCACGSEPIKAECDVITIRPYSTVIEKGLFTTKTERIDYIEYTYQYDGKMRIDTVKTGYLKIGNETKVLVEDGDGYLIDNLVLSLEDYKELYGLN